VVSEAIGEHGPGDGGAPPTGGSTVRSLVMHGVGRMAVEDRPAAPLAPGQVRVAVDTVGYCKTDVLGYLGVVPRRQEAIDAGGPLVMGHEAVGRVVELGPGTDGPGVGTPVAIDPIVTCGVCDACRADGGDVCRDRAVVGCQSDWPGAYAESLVVPVENAVPYVGDAPLAWGALVEPLSVGAHGTNAAGEIAGARVLVLGGGIIGTAAAIQAERRGASAVLVSEPLPERRALLGRLGLTAVAPDDAGSGHDVVVDCVALPETLIQAVDALRRNGRLVVVGVNQPEVALPITRIVDEELRLIGSYAFTKAEFAAVAGWVAAGERDLDGLVEVEVDLDGAVAAFDRYRDPSPPFRTALRPGSAAA
jgi:2-desacetyl-2-hydroxyethyl bacteriochlorophyllide A dehydrogenase